MAQNSFIKKLQTFFGFNVEKQKIAGGITDKEMVVPVESDEASKSGASKRIKLSSEVERMWKWYTSEVLDNTETLKNREDRYKDIDFMIYNDTIVSMVVDLYADEVAQADDQFNLIGVTSRNPKVTKKIKELFNLWGVDQEYIREVGYNLVSYGDSFDIIDANEKEGIIGLTPIDVRDIQDRLEFKASEVEKKFKGKSNSYISKNKSINRFLQDVKKEGGNDNLSKSYVSYLFGFLIGDNHFVYPWQVNHYRLKSRKSEFFPFGRSLLINLIGPYRQLRASMNLMALTRTAKFPKEIYEVETSDEMTSVEKWQAVNEAKTEFANLGRMNRAKDEFSVGDEVWMPSGLISHTTISNDLRVDDIADIELLRENLIMGTRVPKGYLIVDRGGWGTSGQSLLNQSKPFGRSVYSVQSSILKNLSHLVRMHFLMTGEFEKELTEFQISLNYPVVEESADRLRMKQDSLRLANDILDNIKNALGLRNEELPPEIVKKIFSKFSFLDDEDVEEVVKSIASAKEEPDDSSDDDGGFRFSAEKLSERLNEEVFNDAYFDALNKFDVQECVRNKRHYLASSGKFIQNEYASIYKMYRQSLTEDKLEE